MHCGNCGHPANDESLFCGSCGAKREDLSPFRVGGMLAAGRYRVEAQLGEGGMGTVWRAHDTLLGRTVALKCLAAELTAHPTARRRMAQEARVLARVQSPYVVQVRNVFEEAGLLVLELEYVSGGDLDDRLRSGPMDEQDMLGMVTKALAGLQAIHDAGLIHRDIKPGNVLLDAQGQPKITDLGIAHDPTAQEKTHLGARLGTPHYMSPEQIRGVGVDVRSDVYSMGVMCYQLLTGQLPFAGSTEFDVVSAHIHEAPDLGKLARFASPQTVAWVARALAKQPSDRWPDAKSMAAAAQAMLTGAVVAGPVAAAAPAAPTSPSRAAEPADPVIKRNIAPPQPFLAKPAAQPPPVVVNASKNGRTGWLIAAAVITLVVVVGGGFAIVTAVAADTVEVQAPSDNTAAAAVATAPSVSTTPITPKEPAVPQGPPPLIPPLQPGDRWRFRYQRTPRDSKDLWRTRDHFVDRTVMAVTPIPGGIAVKMKEVGGPSNVVKRIFTEIYNGEGVGRQTKEGVVISANWSTQTERAAPQTVAPSEGKTLRLQGSASTYWLHERLGKIGERTISGRHRDTYALTLVGYAVGGKRGGSIDGTPQRCIWNGRMKWLTPGTTAKLVLAGAGHKYFMAKGARGALLQRAVLMPNGRIAAEMPSSLTLEGSRVRSVKIGGGLGSLLVAKTWISPSHGEWVAALWHSFTQTTLSISHLEGSSASTFNIALQTIVTDRRKFKRNHSLLILQRGNDCVLGVKGTGPGGRKFMLIRAPDSGGPSILGGDWPRKR